MQFLNLPIRTFFSYREERLVSLYEHAIESQEKWFNFMIENGFKTKFGKTYGLKANTSYQEFCKKIPIQDYNSLFPYIDSIISGEQNVLWHTKIDWLAKSSGTTQGRSKYIPVSQESLKENNIVSASDCLTCYTHMFPETEIFSGKTITLGGSIQPLERESPLKCGDISAILMENMPAIGLYLNAPHKDILLLSNWNQKLKLIAENTVNENITAISGVPSWMLLVLKEVLAISGKEYIDEVWPNLEVFFHGGVSFAPYKDEYKKLFFKKEIFFMNIYNASEGFFGIQNERDSDEMLLLTDNCVFYEFIEINEIDEKSKKAIPLSQVKLSTNYALVITTAAGLWRYEIGDTIIFTSLHPYKFKISGRTTQYMNAFGEEVIVDNAEKAITKACKETDAIINNFTAAPIFLNSQKSKGGHQWAIEFTQYPFDIELFTNSLDQALKSLNSDYDAKRTDDLMLAKPLISVLKPGTFIKWLGIKNKLGGQHKVPRLQNNRDLMEEILSISDLISHSDSL